MTGQPAKDTLFQTGTLFPPSADNTMSSSLKRLAINDEGFAFDPATGDSFLLNTTGSVLLRGLQEELDELALIERIMARFEVDSAQAAADVDDFLVQLRALKLL